MNLFYLDTDLDKCAEAHVDKHIVKMPIEVAQILCTNLWIDTIIGYAPRALTKEENKVLSKARVEAKETTRLFPYLPTMQNHPCTIWARISLDNYEWTHCYGDALGSEYTYRYGKVHQSVKVINSLPDPKNIPYIGFTTFGLAMPDILKDYNDPIESYRRYYHLDKATFASWKNRSKPTWWDDNLADYKNRITRNK